MVTCGECERRAPPIMKIESSVQACKSLITTLKPPRLHSNIKTFAGSLFVVLDSNLNHNRCGMFRAFYSYATHNIT